MLVYSGWYSAVPGISAVTEGVAGEEFETRAGETEALEADRQRDDGRLKLIGHPTSCRKSSSRVLRHSISTHQTPALGI